MNSFSLTHFPFPFWAAFLLTIGTGAWFWKQLQIGYGLPGLAVLGTVFIWYFGDAIYNDYSLMKLKFGDETLAAAWWEVALFVTSFTFFVPHVHRGMNRKLKQKRSEILRFAAGREIESRAFQQSIDRFLVALVVAWIPLMALAMLRTNFDYVGLFFPWLGHKAEPWGRDRIGGGIDAILSLSSYVQVFLTASFGVIAAVSRNRKTRFIALLICSIALPYFLFDRTRNTMLSTVLPGLLAWVFLGLRGNVIVRFAILAAAFLALESWLSLVMKARGEGKSVASAFETTVDSPDGAPAEEADEKNAGNKHLGLNMFEELAWINSFIERGTYTPNGGERYFAELVNPVPRSLWPGKPLIGIDYARARGFAGGGASSAGVVASVSTGMIGQGLTNFGRFFGPIAAALIMAIWVGILARQDLSARNDPGRLLLYSLGLVLTFNLGRDVTLLVLYPFLFGSLIFLVQKRYLKKSSSHTENYLQAPDPPTYPIPPEPVPEEKKLTRVRRDSEGAENLLNAAPFIPLPKPENKPE
ncbi:MAG: hypothetical protein KA250_11630 [Verrucomicrobiales bacterium]|jgi:hypothetical protein|nr:hypothetical protein [Verrucomicrobiales bacterium]MBP9223620.1 hypothetical protein [Verrucomicrobiales bacterium]